MDPDRQLVRELGLRQLTAHIVNYTVGSGIFVVPAARTPLRIPGGPLVPLVTCALIGWIAVQTASRTEALAFAAVWLLSLVIHARRSRRRSAQFDGTT